MTDRIDSMTHDELKTLTRELVAQVAAPWNDITSQSVINALKPFRPTPLDRLREFLESEGWKCGKSWSSLTKGFGIPTDGDGVDFYTHPDWK